MILEVEQLAVRYNEVPAVHRVSFSVPAGEIVALLGSNGSGKSSILRAIAGLTAASSGRIVFDLRDITREPAHLRAAIGLTLVPEGRRLFPKLSVEKNLRLGAYARRDSEEIERALGLVFTLFPVLKERRLQMAGTLSGGEQQMLAIGRGLAAKPKLLMLDEPSLGLGPLLGEELLMLIKTINAQGVALLLIEQNVVQSLDVAQRAYILDNGRFVLEGPAAELGNDPKLKHAYLGM